MRKYEIYCFLFFLVAYTSEGFIPLSKLQIKQRSIIAESSSSDYLDNLTNYNQDDRNVGVSCDALGGDIKRIQPESHDDGVITKLSVPTFAAFQNNYHTFQNKEVFHPSNSIIPKRMGLEGLVEGAFVIENALSIQTCEAIIEACENSGFGKFNQGGNHHGAMQILVSPDAADAAGTSIFPYVDIDVVNRFGRIMARKECILGEEDVEYEIVGLNRRWRIYRYETGGNENFAPHIDAGFPPSAISDDGTTLIWDARENGTYTEDTVSRMTVLMYLNDDFQGGHTKFFSPRALNSSPETIAAVKPKAGSILIFPQAVGEKAVEHARMHWPLHEGSKVTTGSRPKYVIRSDVLFAKARSGLTEGEKTDPLWMYDELVRNTFLPESPAISSRFLNHLQSLYNPHMGVENVGPLLYSFIRFSKVRTAVEIGAGFTTPWILQALKDNDDEMSRIKTLNDDGYCRLLDISWTPDRIVDDYNRKRSSLLCIDNCLHQRETATGAAAVAKTLGLSDYLEFIMGDAYDMKFEAESIDLLWCDFGVGARMRDFAKGAWKAIRPGGFLVCHSTLTNSRTREWLEAVRRRAGEEETGMPKDEFVEISLLEPHKVYQNSVTFLQRRKSLSTQFVEPIYSEYA